MAESCPPENNTSAPSLASVRITVILRECVGSRRAAPRGRLPPGGPTRAGLGRLDQYRQRNRPRTRRSAYTAHRAASLPRATAAPRWQPAVRMKRCAKLLSGHGFYHALTNTAGHAGPITPTPPQTKNPKNLPILGVLILVAWDGIEPSTRGFSIRCSTN
ncbi:hypothetical protein BCEP27_110090 [Burkholderia cepacia]